MNSLNNSLTLAESFETDTKQNLITIARCLSLKVNTKQRKAEIAKRLANTFLRDPFILLHQIPFSELLRLQRMIDNPDGIPANPYGYIDTCLFEIGITDTYFNGKQNMEFVYPEAREAFRPVVKQLILSNEQQEKSRKEQLLLGLLNLYGILSLFDIVELFKKYEPAANHNALMDIVTCSYWLKKTICEVEGSFYLHSPFLIVFFEIFGEIKLHDNLPYAEFGLQEVMTAGDMEHPLPPSGLTEKTQKILQSMGMSPEDSVSFISTLWSRINNQDQEWEFVSRWVLGPEINRNGETDILIRELGDCMSRFPRWIHLGHYPQWASEILKEQILTQQSLISSLKAEILHNKAMMDSKKSISHNPWLDTDSQNIYHIGRNDLCPCGSGKKYKKCCGNT